jgi:ABC-2 type transport system permease protein
MNPGHVFTVVRREYMERVRTKSFILSTIAIPLFLLAMLLIPAFMAARGAETRTTLVILDGTGVLEEGLGPRLEEADFNLADPDVASLAADSLEALIEAGELGGILVLDQATMTEGHVVFRGREGPSTIRSFGLQRAVMESVLEVRLREAAPDADVAAFLEGGELEVELVGLEDQDEAARDAARFTALLGVFLLYFILILYGQYVMRAVLEEKRDRIVEIVISSIRPSELMLGKILGVGGVGLTQLVIWVASAAFMVLMVVPMLVVSLPSLENVQELVELIPAVETAVLLLVFFPLGYFLYAALYAAAGAMCSSDEEVQQAQLPITLIIVAAFMLVITTMDGPAPAWAQMLAMFPLFSPIMMFSQATQGLAPMWQVVLSVVLLAASVPAVAWVAGRIYRVGILMQGKRPTLPELVRWVRQA